MKLHRTIGPSAVATALTGATFVWLMGMVAAAGGGQTPADRAMTAGEAFKNVQVMKDMPVGDFLGSMGLMCAALAGDCETCHVAAGSQFVDWAADTPRKRTARRMVTMVQTINQQHFGGRVMVTCWTCHRNGEQPEVTPTMDVMYGAPILQRSDVVVQRPGMPTADSLLDKYLQALGGAERVAQVTSYVAKGTSTGFGGFGGGGEFEIYAQAPDKRATIIVFPKAPDRGDSTRTYNGSEGWIMTPLSVLGEYKLSGGELDGARIDAQLGFPANIKTLLSNLRVGFPETIDDRTVNVVQGDGPNDLLVTMYFDAETGLLSRVIRYTRSPIGRIPTQEDFADYRDVGGVKMPFRFTFSWLDGRDTFTVTDIQTNVSIPDTRFQRRSTSAGR